MKYPQPGRPDSVVHVEPRYENFIGGKWQAPASGRYSPDPSPATGRTICEVPKSTPEDIELALDAAHAARDAWGEASPAARAEVLNAVADAIDANREMLAVTESWENGKPVRETLAADIPLAADHFRYFAAAARAQESIYDEFMARALDRIGRIRQGDPLDTETMIGPQVSARQRQTIASYVDIGRAEGAEVLAGGRPAQLGGEFADGYFHEPTVLTRPLQPDEEPPGQLQRPAARVRLAEQTTPGHPPTPTSADARAPIPTRDRGGARWEQSPPE
jgi:acyl-CoA reductase-like NAD-dependent aldehyde dehydrogenase